MALKFLNDGFFDGKVGIGTDTPSAKLEITGSTPTAGDTTLNLKLPVGNVTAGVTEMGNILFSSTDENVGGSGSIAKISTIAGNGNDAWIGQGRPTDLAFFTQPIGQAATLVEAMRIDQDGYVGIGTDNPNERLHVKSAERNVVANFESTDAKAYISFKDSATTNTDTVFLGAEGDNMTFYVGNAESERMRIDDTGNVGIGATNPLTLLNLEGVKNTSIITLESTTNDANWSVGDKIGAINFYSADDSGAGEGVKASMSYENSSGGTGATNALVFNTAGTTTGTNNTERMRIDSAGDTSFTGNVTTGASLISTNAIVDNVVVKTANGNLTFKANGGSTIAQFYNDLNATFIGNVGIGETNPSYKLDVDGSGARIGSSNQTTTSLYLTATNTDGAPAIATQIIMQGYEGRAKGTFYTDVSETGEWFDGVPYNASHNYWHVGFDETGGEAEYRANSILTVRDNGNVGIGEGDPTEKFVVNGSVNSINQSASFATGPYRATMDIISSIKLVRIGSVKGAVTPTGDEGEVAFFVNSVEKARIDKDGNLGIGTTNPTESLEVSGKVLIKSTAPFLDFSDTNSFTDVNDRFRIRAHTDNGEVQWYDDSTTLVKTIMEYKSSGDVVINNGNVGIGTTNLTAPLQVAGISEYTNNTTAKAAGLTTGAFYRTGDLLKVVH